MDRHFSITSRTGIYTAPTGRSITIGHIDGCDIKIPNATPYADEIIAKIVPNPEDDGWHLVRLARHWPVAVNGVEINRVHYLADKDMIECTGFRGRFQIHEGRQSEPTVVHIHRNGRLLWAIVAAVAVIACIVGYRIYDSDRELLTPGMQSEIEASLFTTRVRSLQLWHGDSLIDTYTYDSSPVGTAFLTTDSLIVTARHCLQPWLNNLLPHEYSRLAESEDWPVAKALFAETHNQLSDSAIYRIVSFINFIDEQGNSFDLSSDCFSFNYDFDDIVELGSYSEPLYWRSISHRYHSRDMMLGDIAVARHDKGGLIPLADASDIRRLLHKRGVKLSFFGHPESGVSGNQLDRQSDELRLPVTDLESDSTRLFMLAHEGGLTPGFSGGPVIARDGMGYKAVGVISVTDDRNDKRSYSVPTSEIKFLKP